MYLYGMIGLYGHRDIQICTSYGMKYSIVCDSVFKFIKILKYCTEQSACDNII